MSNGAKKHTVLIVDSSDKVHQALSIMLEEAKAKLPVTNILVARSKAQAFQLLEKNEPRFIIANAAPSDLEGSAFIIEAAAKPELAQTPLFILTNEAGQQAANQAMRPNLDCIIMPEEILNSIDFRRKIGGHLARIDLAATRPPDTAKKRGGKRDLKN